MESIRGYFKALKWRSLIVAFSAILLGLLFILTPQASADVICYVAGILLLASGIAAVISYLASGRLFGSYALVSGIVLLVCGVFCLLRPEIIQGLLTVLFGVFLVIDGMMTLQDGVDCARARLAGWWVPALLGAVTIALGCVVLFGKFDSIMLLAGDLADRRRRVRSHCDPRLLQAHPHRAGKAAHLRKRPHHRLGKGRRLTAGMNAKKI